MLTYKIWPASVHAHLFHIRLSVPVKGQETILFRLPAWIPGSYMIRDFAKNIVTMKAFSNQKEYPIEQIDKHSWQVATKDLDVVEIHYEVYAFDLSVRGAFLDKDRAFFNHTSLCLYVEGQRDQPCQLLLSKPELPELKHWQLATALPAIEIDQYGFGLYQADSYDCLIDCPVEMGCFSRLCFDVLGIPHEFIISGIFNGDLERLVHDTQKICAAQIKLFSGQAPFERYVFLLHVSDDVYGGLEHLSSTALLASRDCLPMKGAQALTDEYIQLLGLISHEYFHAWNVKSIKPQAFEEYDLNQEVYTKQLWAFEGITSYYDDLMLLRSGVIDARIYLDLLAKNITRVQRGNGRTKQTLTQSSFNAWTKYYKQDENSINAIVSYYQKGALFALALDLYIREQTGQQHSLDDVMRALYQYYKNEQLGVKEEGQWQSIAEQTVGVSLAAFFKQGLNDVQDLPLSKLLKYVGIDFYWLVRPYAQLGGFVDAVPDNQPECIDLGFKYQNIASGLKVSQVLDCSIAQQAGIYVADELIALNGYKITDFYKQLERFKEEGFVHVHLFRHGVLQKVRLELTPLQENTCYLMASQIDQIQWLNIF
ncbi:M61 family metallopeptidase [Neisseria sp. Ec49-e6-T10]|uniref:M61 family metallopeptidase n=1 Tax=Neisseria sp. Ec49-e6-T10 TaxID=3140744 RepID=UPI003EBFD9F5